MFSFLVETLCWFSVLPINILEVQLVVRGPRGLATILYYVAWGIPLLAVLMVSVKEQCYIPSLLDIPCRSARHYFHLVDWQGRTVGISTIP